MKKKKQQKRWGSLEYTWDYKGPLITATIHGYVHHPPESIPISTPPNITVIYPVRATNEELAKDKKAALALIREALTAILKEVDREEKK